MNAKEIVKDSVSGFYLFKALGFIKNNKTLIKYGFFQVIVSAIFMIAGIYYVIFYGGDVYDKLFLNLYPSGEFEWYISTLYYSTFFIFEILFLLVSLVTTLLFSQIINAPVNSAMSEKVELLYLKQKGEIDKSAKKLPKSSELPFFKQIFKDVFYEVKKFTAFTLILAAQLPLMLIPFFGTTLFAVTVTITSMYTLTYDFIDYPMERDNLKLRKRIRLLLTKPGIWVGYGGIIYLIFMVPFLNILLWPVLMTSGTLIYIDKFKKRDISNEEYKKNLT